MQCEEVVRASFVLPGLSISRVMEVQEKGKGVMDKSTLRCLLNIMSSFTHIVSCNNIKLEPVQRDYPKIVEMLKLLRPVLDKIVDAQIELDEQLTKEFEELDMVVNETRELMEGWQPLMSRIYTILQIEPLVGKIQRNALEICQLLCSSPQSALLSLDSAFLQNCLQELQCIRSDETSDAIKRAIKDQKENLIPSSESLARIADSLSLTSNQELLMEAVALEKVKLQVDNEKNEREVEYIDQIIALVMCMHECLVKIKQSQAIDRVPVPPDFCCPLSLELMSDPVIVASGQTYERAFIRKWLDQGLTVCPKTRQSLAHTNLIPNFTVKALIANWCESNNVKMPDPIKSMSSNQSLSLLARSDHGVAEPSTLSQKTHVSKLPRSPERARTVSPHQSFLSSNGTHPKPSPPYTQPIDGVSLSVLPLESQNSGNMSEKELSRVSLITPDDQACILEEQKVGSSAQAETPSGKELSECSQIEDGFPGHNRSASVSSAASSTDYTQGVASGEVNEVSRASSDMTQYASDASGEVTSEPTPTSSTPIRDKSEMLTKPLEGRSRGQNIWRRPLDRGFVPRIVSTPSMDSRPDLLGVETEVRKLVEDLQSPLDEVKRDAAAELRLLAKHNMENRIVIANCGAIRLLVGLLHSEDLKTQENAVTALLNLSINDNNKTIIANEGAIEPLIHVLRTGNPEARENSAATLFSLSVIEENKIKIGRSDAIKPLVHLLGNGTPRGKKDAATALFNLSIFHENKARIVHAGAVKHLVDLMDPAAGMVDKAVAVLANLATIPEGRTAIGAEGGITALVEVVELGSSRGKENAAAALLQLCTNSHRFCSNVLQEGAVPPLVALSQSGTPRAREKAQSLLSYFRNQRHGNVGRGG
ncbi:hypothetical protein AMTRI_Chr02g255000 [Amborella trichopoda]